MFQTLSLYEGNITPTVFESFMKHYFAGYKSFVKHGGLSNHNTYQMHYLDMLHKKFHRNKKKNKYAIKKVKMELERQRISKLKEQEEEKLRQAREAKKREEELLAQQEELEHKRKETEAKHIKKLYKERLDQQKKRKKKKHENENLKKRINGKH